MFRVAEVKAVHESNGTGTRARQVEDRFGDDQRRAPSGIHGAPAVVAIGSQSQAPAGVRTSGRVAEAQHGGIVPWADHRIEEQLVVVLAVHPRRVGKQSEQVLSWVVRRLEILG